MTREQAKQKLISYGVAEPTDEQVSDLLNSIGAETRKEKERADAFKTKADTADELQRQLDEVNAQNMSEVERTTKALEEANKKIAELERKYVIRTQRATVMESFGITAEQANQVVKDDGSTDYAVLGQIFADGKKNAVAEFEKQTLQNTPNPDGKQGGNENKTTAEKIAEKLMGDKPKADNDILSHYINGGN